jgi:UDP-N-acetyl-D-mannosaminuronic acid transferase (WecB/TagA/CpsF family)
MSMHSEDAKLVDVAGIVLGFLDVHGDRVRHELSDADFAEALMAVEEARHPWRAARVRIREARGSRAGLSVRAH